MPEQTIAAEERSPLFTFVVVADTHVNEAERMSTSPYETNHLSNPRARHVFTEIAAMRPARRAGAARVMAPTTTPNIA